MLDLLQGQRKTSDADEMMRSAAQAVGLYLNADRAGFFEIPADGQVTFSAGWTAGRLPLLSGPFPALQMSSRYLAEVAGKTMGIRDARTNVLTGDSIFPEIGTLALIHVPIIRNGQRHAGFYVHHGEVREWTEEEVALAQDVGEQTWDAIERTRNEAALRKSEERLTFALEAGGGVGTWDWDIANDQVYTSSRFAQLFHVDPERAAAGASLSEFMAAIHPEDRGRVTERIRETVKAGGYFAEEYRVMQSDGSVRWAYARGRCHLDDMGVPKRFPGVVFDITERKQVEAALEQQWRTFDTVLSHIPDFAYIFDREGRFTYVNRTLLSLWQKTLEEARGRNFFELDYPEELAARLQSQIQEVISTKAPVRDQTPYTGPDGKTLHYDYIFVPILSASGQVEAVAGSTREITERFQAEEALREGESRFRFLAESIPQMVWTADPAGHIFWYNRRWYDYTGTTLEEMAGWGWQKVHDPEILPGVLAEWKKSIATGEPLEMVFPIRRADGEFRQFLTRVNPVKDGRGRVLQWFGTNTDITDQTRTEEQLRKANRELEEFAYVASHDLQEPLRMVNIYTQMIVKGIGRDDPSVKEYGAFVRQGVARMEALIRDLLTYSRTVHLDVSAAGTASLTAALAEAKSVLKDRIEESGALIEAEPLPTLRGDTAQFSHVFQNLLSNAMKYRKKGITPAIAISSSRSGDRWVIAVRDNGIGFEQRYAERIFGLFKRLHNEEFPGTGLGLAICQRTIERYGGNIWAEGRPGEGATFYFSLPSKEVG